MVLTFDMHPINCNVRQTEENIRKFLATPEVERMSFMTSAISIRGSRQAFSEILQIRL